MKKTIYFLTMILAVALMSTSCEKDDPIVPEGITAEDLIGDWNFQSLEFGGNVYTTCDEDLNEDYDMSRMSFLNVTTSTLNIYVDCTDNGSPNANNYEYVVENGYIIIDDDYYTFKILNPDDFDGNTLILELTDAIYTAVPIGGIYTLTK